MAMRETVRTLRAYFILSGLASMFFSGSALRENLQGTFTIATVVSVASIGFSLAFLYVGFSLAALLKSSASRIVTLLYASTAWTLIVFLLSLVGGFAPLGLITLILTLLILWYLLKNIRRLAAEAQGSSPGAAPSGT